MLIGGTGADTLAGGHGRDLLIGGTGRDPRDGGTGEDILIAGHNRVSLSRCCKGDSLGWTLRTSSFLPLLYLVCNRGMGLGPRASR